MSDSEVRLSDRFSEISFWEKHQKKSFSDKEWLVDMDFNGEEEVYLLFISQGRYREIFEYASLTTKEVYDFHHLYHSISEILMAVILLHGFKNPDYFEMLKNCDEKPEKILYAFEKEIAKLDFLFDEYTEQIEKNQNALLYTSKTIGMLDFTIKEYPRNTTEREKDILNHLSNNYHIKRELSSNGLLPLFGKNGTKRLLETFYKYAPDYKDFQAFNFLKYHIETNLPDATLQNYCREVRKYVMM